MRERGIILSAWEIRAILEGRKGQLRRVCKPQPDAVLYRDQRPMIGFNGKPLDFAELACPYGQPGDRLIVTSEIPGVDDTYCAGSDGLIYSRARGDWRPLRCHRTDGGYPSVTVMLSGRKTTRSVHSLVCAAFYGPAPFPSAQVRHLDGNALNSVPSNLAWGTQAENWLDRRAHGNGCEGEKHHAAKLSDEERAHVRWAVQHGLCSQKHAARALGMAQGSICKILEGSELRDVVPVQPALLVPTILLEVTEVRVQRLKEISEEDAWAEGLEAVDGMFDEADYCARAKAMGLTIDDARPMFAQLWDSSNAKRGHGWSTNPFVWAVSFRVLAAVEGGAQ